MPGEATRETAGDGAAEAVTGDGAAGEAVTGDGPAARPAAGATRRRLAEMVAEASDGEITAEEALAAEVPLTALGFTSLAQMRLIDAVESEFGIEFDLSSAGISALNDLDALERHLAGTR
ncbi:acyl carrier protein [Planomonospora sp. ID82291]|nr:acyl carrier protein [Planomonospora sp. ID82291]